MSISSTTNRVSYSGNGSTTVFSFPYNFFSNSDLVVISRVTSTGVETTKTLTTHYTVTGAGVDGGGSVTMLTAPATGTTLIIYRDTAATQSMTAETDFFDTSSVEDALDRAAQASQRLASRVDRAVRLTEGAPSGFDPKLPELLVANAVLAVNAGGTAFEWGPDQDVLVDAADAADASATAAAASAAAAAASAGAAATSETNAAASAVAADASADAAAASAVDAANNAAASVSDTAYDATSWNAVTTIAPSKNAVRDQVETMLTAIDAKVSDTAYNATTWDGVTTIAPSKNAVRDQVETMLTAIDAKVSDTAYNATTWDAVTTIAPSKNAVRDQIETMLTSIAASLSDTAYNATTWDGVTTAAPTKNAVRDQFEALRDLSETLTQKTMTSPIINTPKLEGGSASNTSRWTMPSGTLAALTALTRNQASFAFATDTLKAYVDTGAALVGIGGGGGGSALQWIEDANAPLAIFENSSRVYTFESALAQLLYATIKVPSTYTAGDPIKLRMVYYNADTSGNALISSVATLVRTGTDLMSSTTNQRTSTNAAVTMSGATQNIPQALILDLTTTTGTINSVAVAAGDIIKISITRGSDTATSDIKVPVYGAEVTFS